MKVPVASIKTKVLYTIVAILAWTPTVYIFAAIPTKLLFEGEAIMATILLFALGGSMTVYACFALFSSVIIDENGITLRRGVIKVNHISWRRVRRVEIFKALHRRSVLFSDTYIRILTTEEESWAYQYRLSPLNIDAESISFVYDTQADNLIKQYYTGDIYR